MRTRALIPGLFLAVISLLAGVADAAARAARSREPEHVGNMKRIVIPDNGVPQTTIAPSGKGGATNSRPLPKSSPSTGPSNPTPNQVPVTSMIGGGLKTMGPLPIR